MDAIKSKSNRKKRNIKKIEQYLRSYRNYVIGIKSLQKQLDHIMPDITVSYEVSEGSTGTFNIKSDTENYAIDRIESKQATMIYEDIANYQIIIDSIDSAVSNLDSIQKKFIELRYFDKKTIAEVSIELGYSEKYIFNLRKQIMDELLISLRALLSF